MHFSQRVMPLALALSLAGCTTILGPKAHPPENPEASFFAPAHYVDGAFEKDIKELNLGEPLSPKERQFVGRYIRIIDTNYASYVNWLSSGRASADVTYDSIGLASTGIAAISTVASIKTGLAALGTFTQGQKSSIDKSYYQGKVIFTLINVMETSRSDIRARIRQGLQSKTYTLHDALFDIEGYYKVGTIDIALTTTSVAAAAPPTPPAPAASAASAPDPAASSPVAKTVTATSEVKTASSKAESSASDTATLNTQLLAVLKQKPSTSQRAQAAKLAASAAEASDKTTAEVRKASAKSELASAAAIEAAAVAAARKPAAVAETLPAPATRFRSANLY